ncbi:MAG: hypothetical protein AVDCRST_MAG93-3174, partial [uncultured Chloroflexia bacterium]
DVRMRAENQIIDLNSRRLQGLLVKTTAAPGPEVAPAMATRAVRSSWPARISSSPRQSPARTRTAVGLISTFASIPSRSKRFLPPTY